MNALRHEVAREKPAGGVAARMRRAGSRSFDPPRELYDRLGNGSTLRVLQQTLPVDTPGLGVEREVDDFAERLVVGGARRASEPVSGAPVLSGSQEGGLAARGQSAVGNLAESRVLSARGVHPNLTPSQPGDPEEMEADRMADAVVSRSSPPATAKAGQSTPRPGSVGRAIAAVGGGQPLPRDLRDAFEPHFGRDLSGVRIHLDARAGRAAHEIGARAYTVGTHIAFAPGEFQPGDREGQRLVAHELAHVARGHDGVKRNSFPSGEAGTTGGITVTLAATAEPLSRYGWLRDTLGIERWGALNDAARLRAARRSGRSGSPVTGGEGPTLALTARSTVRVPMTLVLRPQPYTPDGSFRGMLFEALCLGPIAAAGAGGTAIRDEIIRHWARIHEPIVRGHVDIQLVDPAGALATPDELLLTVAGFPVPSIDGQLWIPDIDNAITPGQLETIVEQVARDASEVGEAATISLQVEKLIELAQRLPQRGHNTVAGNEAEGVGRLLSDYAGHIRKFAETHILSSQLLSASAIKLAAVKSEFEPWLMAHRAFLVAVTPGKNTWERQVEQTTKLMKAMDEAPWYAKGAYAQALESSAMAHGVPDLLSGGAVSADVELRRAFRLGDVSLKGFLEGEEAIRDRGLVMAGVNLVIIVGTLGLGAAIEPVSLGGQIAFGGLTSAAGTGISLTTQTLLTNRIQLSDPLAQQIWQAGAMSSGDIALASLGSGIVGAGMAGALGWLSRGANPALARQLVAESLEGPGFVRALGPGLDAKAVVPGVIEVIQSGQPVMRFTVQGWEALPGATGGLATSGSWTVPINAAGTAATGPLRGMAVFQQSGAMPYGVAVGKQGWVVLAPSNLTVASGPWGVVPGQAGAAMVPFGGGMPGRITIGGGPLGLPVGSPGTGIVLPPAFVPGGLAQGGPLFVDVQGGPAIDPTSGQLTFLPTLVGQTPGAQGMLLEPGDYRMGYGGITTTNARDLEMARVLAQNLPEWPAQGAGQIGPQQPPSNWNPLLAFPTQGPVQVLTTAGAAGTTPVPQAFFPPVGSDVVPGVPRLIPIQIGPRTAQQDVTGLQPSTHRELHGRVDRAFWRRPFALGSADPQTTAAMGKEIARWLKPGGFIELRLLRGSEERQALAIAAQIPGARIVTVPRGAIATYARTGARPARLTNEQWAVLQEAGPDVRGEFGALGQGQFARIVRIYRGGTPQERVLLVGAERADELDWAAGLQASGHDVTVVNPHTSPAARQFRRGGGHLVTGTVESLPSDAAFNVIREDFPFPLGRVIQPTVAFAQARIGRLVPGGRWVIATESAEFATTLRAAAAMLDVEIVETTVPRAHEVTPTSPWLPVDTPQQIIIFVFTRRPR